MSAAEQCGLCGAVLPAHTFECPLWHWPARRGLLRVAAASAILATLFGCAAPGTLPNDAAAMTPEQIRALASDRNVNVACTTFNAVLYGTVTTVSVVVDRDVLKSGAGVLKVAADCTLSIQASPSQ